MANCIYCKQPAGILRTMHPECEISHSHGIAEIKSVAIQSLQPGADLSSLPATIAQINARSLISAGDSKKLLIQAWDNMIESRIDQSGIDAETEARLLAFANAAGISQQDLNLDQSYQKLVKALVLRDIAEGKLPNRAKIEGAQPINLQKGEQIVWLHQNAELLMDKTYREYVGKSAGVSVRIMKGVYYRTSAFRGHPIERTEKVIVDRGTTVITNKHITFVGARKSFRFPYRKIISFIPFSDGIGIMKDAANAKLQTIVTGDGWFTYNLVMGLSQFDASN
ncbi:MAG: hypothetical protein WDM86_06800 [Rhizomicrobium sp.]